MIKIDLITGFLGSGKTTFLKKYAARLIECGMRVGIVENDYGAVNVDMMLLAPLGGDMCEIETVAGACDYDCHKRRFKTKLIAMGMRGLDRVIVEPSGIFDVDEFFDTLREEPLENWYEIGSVIAVADPTDTAKFSDYAEYILASQVASAGTLLLSKTQLCTDEQISKAIAELNRALEASGFGKLPEESICAESWDELSDSQMDKIIDSGYRICDSIKSRHSESGFQTLYYMNLPLNTDDVKEIVETLFDGSCGDVFRVKGFFRDNGWHELNATAEQIKICPIENGQEVIIVIGENLDKNRINGIFNSKELSR